MRCLVVCQQSFVVIVSLRVPLVVWTPPLLASLAFPSHSAALRRRVREGLEPDVEWAGGYHSAPAVNGAHCQHHHEAAGDLDRCQALIE